MEAPGDVAGGAHEVFLAFAAAGALSLINEGMVGGAHTFQEQVMAVQELAVALQEEHGDGQHASQDVSKPVAQLQHTFIQAKANLKAPKHRAWHVAELNEPHHAIFAPEHGTIL